MPTLSQPFELPVGSRVLVTGASGFVGRALCGNLLHGGFLVRGAVRDASSGGLPVQSAGDQMETCSTGDLGSGAIWGPAVSQIGAVVHLAARVHVMRDAAVDPLIEYRRINVEATENLARAAVRAKVKRFVYVSSIKVLGENTCGAPFTEETIPQPRDPYGLSKLEAEQSLRAIADESGLELVIVRAPLIYGPGMKANLLYLIQAVASGLPLPLASVRNRRSLVGLDNLCDFLRAALIHPMASGNTFLISDGEDLSTPDLIRRLAAALDRKANLFPVPQPFLACAAALSRRRDWLERLCGSLQVDSRKARTLLAWQPPFTVDQGLRKAALWFNASGPEPLRA